MSIFLYSLGAIAVVAGGVMAGFGVPVSEFSFGNTLITAGATTAVGGLIVIGLGAVVAQLQQVVEAGQGQAAVQPHRSLGAFESTSGRPAAARVTFPSKPKPETLSEPQPAVTAPAAPPPEVPLGASFAPNLPNPDEPPVTVAEDVSLSPPQPAGLSPEAGDVGKPRDEPAAEAQDAKASEEPWRSPEPNAEQRGSFGFMWPSDRKTERPLQEEAQPVFDVESPAPEPVHTPEPAASVAILKSGVVDGMGYTLYVDGSIEAELPQGTLRFASINELRLHLEQNT